MNIKNNKGPNIKNNKGPNIKNNKGPNTDPWTTLEGLFYVSE